MVNIFHVSVFHCFTSMYFRFLTFSSRYPVPYCAISRPIILSLLVTLFFSPSTSSPSFCLRLSFYYASNIVFLSLFTTESSIILTFPQPVLHPSVSQILPTVDSTFLMAAPYMDYYPRRISFCFSLADAWVGIGGVCYFVCVCRCVSLFAL